MVRFVKAYNDGPDTIVELKTVALNERRAALKGKRAIIRMFPAKLTATEVITTQSLGRGIMEEYRVIIRIDGTDGLTRKFGIDKIISTLEEKL